METFFNVKTPEAVFRIIDTFPAVGEEPVSADASLGRILSREVTAPEDLPGFCRSAMDGYAVRAKDTFGASESLPALLEISGEVRMGEIPRRGVDSGEAVKISTGGMLPENTDAVVMVEFCDLLDDRTLEVTRAASPGENVIQPEDDFQRGEQVLARGHVMRPQDLGVLAGLGLAEMWVHKKPQVALISTGDEIVPVGETPLPGQVRDINRYTLAAFCRRVGAEPVDAGLCPDNVAQLRRTVGGSLKEADTVWISGGSSVGTRDLTLSVLEEFADFELLVHGISISPGKPTILGRVGNQPVVGLPGHVASALVVAEVFLSRLVSRLAGRGAYADRFQRKVSARLSRNIESASGREDYIRAKLIHRDGGWIAEPVFGKSGLISILVHSDGLIRVDMNAEGLYQGDWVEVWLYE